MKIVVPMLMIKSSAQREKSDSQKNISHSRQNMQYNADNFDAVQIPPEKMKMLMIGLGSIGILVLMILLLTGGIFRHWLVSLIVLFYTIGAFYYAIT